MLKFKNPSFAAFILTFLVSTARPQSLAAAPFTSTPNPVPKSHALVFKNKTRPTHPLQRQSSWLSLEGEGRLEDRDAYYARLNDSLDPLLSDKRPAPTGDEKMWGFVAGSASAALAGVAAAQATGILPGKPKSK